MTHSKHLVLACNPGPTHWISPHGPASFTPRRGHLRVWGPALEQNPRAWTGDKPLWAARLFVGLSVGDEPRWSVEDVVPIVVRVREAQTGDPSASFVTQRGVYKHRDEGKVVEEDSVQVILLDTAGTRRTEFEEQMIQLAEELAAALQQAEVIVELQRGGIVKRTIGVVAQAG